MSTAAGMTMRLLGAIVIALGLATGGWFVGAGFVESRLGVRSVTVKGLAERDVRADLAIWPLRFVATGNELAVVRDKIVADEAAVRAFVAGAGLQFRQRRGHRLRGHRRPGAGLSQRAGGEPLRGGRDAGRAHRRTSTASRGLAQRVGELIAAGVVLSSEGAAASGPVYLFTGLNAAKPEMVAEATRNARASA